MARTSARRQRRLERLARWVEALWTCKCAYYNVATYRCHGCGRRPPRRLRAEMAATPPVASTEWRPAQDPQPVGAPAAP